MFGIKERRERRRRDRTERRNRSGQVARARKRVEIGKGDFVAFDRAGWYGCHRGWPYRITDGWVTTWTDGWPEDRQAGRDETLAKIAEHLGNDAFNAFLQDYHDHTRVRTAPTLGIQWEKNKTYNAWGDLHGTSFGQTGSGKFVSAVAPACLAYSGPVVVVDPKAEAAAVTARARWELHGQTPYVLDPFDTLGTHLPKQAVKTSYNPLDELDPSHRNFYSDVCALSEALLVSKSEKEPMWQNLARDLLTGVVLLVSLHPEYEGRRDLVEVRSVLSSSGQDEWGVVFRMMRSCGYQPLEEVAGRMEGMPERTFGGVLSQCNTDLQFLGDPAMYDVLRTGQNAPFTFSDFFEERTLRGFDEEDVRRFESAVPNDMFFEYAPWKALATRRLRSGGASLYVVLPPDYLRSHSGWLRLVLTSAMRAAIRKRKGGLPTLMMIDEAFQLGSFDLLPEMYSVLRGYNVRLWTFWQDIGQLSKRFPADHSSILGNSFQQLLATQHLETARYFSDLSGMDEKMIETGRSYTTSSGYSYAGGTTTGSSESVNVGRVVEPRYRPEHFLRLKDDVGCVFMGTGHLDHVHKVRYYDVDWCRSYADPNPFRR